MKKLMDTVMRSAFRTAFRIDADALAAVPDSGPLILYANHICQIEVPLLYSQLQPRPVTGLVKRELWDRRTLRRLLDAWGAIPIRRGISDTCAMRAALRALKERKIVAIAPEGTLTRTGVLSTAGAGIVALALRSGAPVMPMAHWGVEQLIQNLKRGKRTPFHVRIGSPFEVTLGSDHANHETRQAILHEMMCRLALLLPARYRGAYADAARSPYPHLLPML